MLAILAALAALGHPDWHQLANPFSALAILGGVVRLVAAFATPRRRAAGAATQWQAVGTGLAVIGFGWSFAGIVGPRAWEAIPGAALFVGGLSIYLALFFQAVQGLGAWAKQHGLQSTQTPGARPDVVLDPGPIPGLHAGPALAMAWGIAGGVRVQLANVSTPRGYSGMSLTYHVGIAVLPVREPAPIRIVPIGAPGRVRDAVSDQDIQLESDTFARAYRVTCADRRFATAFLHPGMMQAILDAEPPWVVQVSRGKLTAWSNEAWTPQLADRFVRFARAVVAQVPAMLRDPTAAAEGAHVAASDGPGDAATLRDRIRKEVRAAARPGIRRALRIAGVLAAVAAGGIAALVAVGGQVKGPAALPLFLLVAGGMMGAFAMLVVAAARSGRADRDAVVRLDRELRARRLVR